MSCNEGGCVAVFDVGKTKKSLLVYDTSLELRERVSLTLEEYRDGDLILERTEDTFLWLINHLRIFARRYDIRALAVAAHASTFACLDGNGDLTMPVISYTTDPGTGFDIDFESIFGRNLKPSTTTPSMPGLSCMAKGIYFCMQRFSENMSRTETILPLPQYYGFLLTGEKRIEKTYIGAHTYLWDYKDDHWSSMFDMLGLKDVMPAEFSRSWDVLGRICPEIASTTGLGEETVVSVGIHEANASLLPYLVKPGHDFALVSTGAVCMVMHPTASLFMPDDENGKMVFYNTSAFSDLVKTAIFMAGMEYDAYMKILGRVHSRSDRPAYDRELVCGVLADANEFILPSISSFGILGSAKIVEDGEFFSYTDMVSGNLPSFFGEYEKAFVVLELSLAIHTGVALKRVLCRDDCTIYIEGEMAGNELYVRLLASMFPSAKIVLSGIRDAVGVGGALVALGALSGQDPHEFGELVDIRGSVVEGEKFESLDGYVMSFLEKAGMDGWDGLSRAESVTG